MMYPSRVAGRVTSFDTLLELTRENIMVDRFPGLRASVRGQPGPSDARMSGYPDRSSSSASCWWISVIYVQSIKYVQSYGIKFLRIFSTTCVTTVLPSNSPRTYSLPAAAVHPGSNQNNFSFSIEVE